MTNSSTKVKISTITVALGFLILLGPLFDIGTGYYQSIFRLQGPYREAALSPGVIYRGVFLIPVFLILAHLVRSSARLLIYYFGAIFIIGILLRGANNQELDLLRDSQRFLKLMLPLIGFAGMIFIAKYFTNNKPTYHFWRAAALYGFITAFGLVTTDYFGYSLRVYRGVSTASAGLIDSQNSAGLILLLSLPLILYYIYKFHDNRLLLVLLVEGLWLACAFQLSTRAALVGIPSIIVIYHIILFIKGAYTKNAQNTLSYIALILMTGLVAYIFFRNWTAQDVNFVLERFALLAEGHFRNRVPYGLERISRFTLVEHLFGKGDAGFITVENDIVDVYGKFGLLALLPIVFFILYLYARLFAVFLRFRQLSTLTLLLSFTIYTVHGFLAGHALLSSPVNNLFLLVYALSYMEIKHLESSVAPENEPSRKTRVKQPEAVLAYDT